MSSRAGSKVLTVVALLLLVASNPAQDGKKTRAPSTPSTPATRSSRKVQGLVLGPLGKPAVGVEVWAAIYPELDKTVARGRTDGGGVYVLGRIPARGPVWVFSTVRLQASLPSTT